MVRIQTLIWETSRSILCQVDWYKAFSALYENIQKTFLVSYLFFPAQLCVQLKGTFGYCTGERWIISSPLCQLGSVSTHLKHNSLFSFQATAVLFKCIFSIKKIHHTDVLNYFGFVVELFILNLKIQQHSGQ